MAAARGRLAVTISPAQLPCKHWGTWICSRGMQQPWKGGSVEPMPSPASQERNIKAEKMKKKKRTMKRESEGFPLSQGGVLGLAGHAVGSGCGMQGSHPNPGVSCPGVQEGNEGKSIPNKPKLAKTQPKRENTHWALVGMGQPEQGCCPLPLTDRDALDLPLSRQEDLNLSPLQPPSVFSLSWVFFPLKRG